MVLLSSSWQLGSAREGTYGRFTLSISAGSRSCPNEGDYGSSHFPEVAAFSQVRGALRRLLSVLVE